MHTDAPASSDATALHSQVLDPGALHGRTERALTHVLSAARLAGTPPRLAAAVRHAVFPGGGRVRPLLTLAVAVASGDADPDLADAGAAAVELMHCASLVHDDLPIFDDADTRRGRPTVHAQFGEQLALLAGDALIVHAFDAIADAKTQHARRAMDMVRVLVAGVGMPGGIIGGQAWESESRIDWTAYHQAKTGALFEASAVVGALASDAAPGPWAQVGRHVGAAYQVADDLHDMLATHHDGNKPVGQDARLGRPNAVLEVGLDGALGALQDRLSAACDAVPQCMGRDGLIDLVQSIGVRLVPSGMHPPKPLISRSAVG